jgi:hypothetical protein
MKIKWRWSKQEVQREEIRRLPIPAEHVRTVCELYDAYCKNLVGECEGMTARYDLWGFIYEILPETKSSLTFWRLEFTSAAVIHVVEKVDTSTK